MKYLSSIENTDELAKLRYNPGASLVGTGYAFIQGL